MTSDKVMKKILSKMSDKPESLKTLCRRLDCYESNLHRDLKAMAELGLVEKVTSEDGIGWKRLIHI